MRLTPWLIRYGYEQGAFPMASDDGEIFWMAGRQRALFPIEGMHVSRSLAKSIRRQLFEVRFDTSFEQVMRCCLRPVDNWINEEIIQCYTEIHRLGWGHSCECWREGVLVGGVYGIALGGCFCAESMFHRETNASKIALWAMIEHCRELGFILFDAQVMNSHLHSLGAYPIGHREYIKLLKAALQVQTPWSNPSHAEP